MVYEVTGKKPDGATPRHSMHTITEHIDAVNMGMAVSKYLERNPGYAISLFARPVALSEADK